MQRIANLWKSSIGGKIVVILGSIFSLCCMCIGLGALLPDTPTAEPTTQQAIILETITPQPSALPPATITFTSAPTVTDIPLEQYKGTAIARFQTLQEAVTEMVNIHNQFLADITRPQSDPWYSHAMITLHRVTDGANELAGMNNYPPEFEAFHQNLVSMSQEGVSLLANYTTALENQDPAALNNATANLANIITYLNNANSSIVSFIPTSTPLPTLTPIPTATVVFAQPTSASVSYDNNGDGKVTCADFQTQAAAQRAYNAGYTNLDGNDGDGKACESLP